MKRTKLNLVSKSDSAKDKRKIQSLVRQIVMIRDGGCVLRKKRNCGGEIKEGIVIQADHLITRSNSATYADTRLIVCLCRSCHGWKHWHKEEYDKLVKTVLPKQRVTLWERCEEERQSHRASKQDWKIHILALEKELKNLSTPTHLP